MEEQVEEEAQYFNRLVDNASNLDQLHIINKRNISQYIQGTEWLDLIGDHHIKPIRDLVELPKLKKGSSNDREGTYPALCSLFEEYVESLLDVLRGLPHLLRQHLNTTDG